LHPIRHNDLATRRRALGLSQVALARMLGVDRATIHRREKQGRMLAEWHYSLRGVEAELKSRDSKSIVRDHQNRVHQLDLIPDALAERGFEATAVKMKAIKPRPKKGKAGAD